MDILLNALYVLNASRNLSATVNKEMLFREKIVANLPKDGMVCGVRKEQVYI